MTSDNDGNKNKYGYKNRKINSRNIISKFDSFKFYYQSTSMFDLKNYI